MPAKKTSLSAEISQFANAAFNETDRGCALVCAQMLDDKLEEILRTLFSGSEFTAGIAKRLFSPYGPLSTFSARLDVCAALGVIDERQYKRIEDFRKLRNAMAHTRAHISFSDKQVAPIIASIMKSHREERRDWAQGLDEDVFKQTPVDRRGWIIVAANWTATQLIGRLGYSKHVTPGLFARACTTIPKETWN